MRREAHVTNSRGEKCSQIFTHETYPLILKLNLKEQCLDVKLAQLAQKNVQ